MPRKTLLIAIAALAAGTAFALPARADDERMPVRAAVAFWLLDRNNDGAIDKAEIDQLRTAIFDAVDANSDGRVTEDEFTDVLERVHQWRDGHGPRHGHWRKHGRHDGPRMGHLAGHRGERMMDRLDVDKDDGLAKADFIGRTPLLFERTDEDHNGSVSKSEFEEAAGRIGRLILMD